MPLFPPAFVAAFMERWSPAHFQLLIRAPHHKVSVTFGSGIKIPKRNCCHPDGTVKDFFYCHS